MTEMLKELLLATVHVITNRFERLSRGVRLSSFVDNCGAGVLQEARRGGREGYAWPQNRRPHDGDGEVVFVSDRADNTKDPKDSEGLYVGAEDE